MTDMLAISSHRGETAAFKTPQLHHLSSSSTAHLWYIFIFLIAFNFIEITHAYIWCDGLFARVYAHIMSIHRAHECVFRVRYRDQRSRLLSLLIALYEKRRDSSRKIEKKNYSSAKFFSSLCIFLSRNMPDLIWFRNREEACSFTLLIHLSLRRGTEIVYSKRTDRAQSGRLQDERQATEWGGGRGLPAPIVKQLYNYRTRP